MYAKTSLQITRDAGTKNQMRPSRMLFMMKWLGIALEEKHPTALPADFLPRDNDEQKRHMHPAE
jgi:hypothetical protein